MRKKIKCAYGGYMVLTQLVIAGIQKLILPDAFCN